MMPTLADRIAQGTRVAAHRGVPRIVVSDAAWSALAKRLGEGQGTLLGLWGDAGAVHMAVIEEATGTLAVFTCECPAGKFPSVGLAHPPAIRLERAIADLYGHEPVGAPDPRPWLDHARWGISHPLGSRTQTLPAGIRYPFLPVEGESLHQIPVGPVHAGIIEPGHFRFTASGETVVRLEQRLGYVHKGIDALMAGASLERAGAIAGRTSGDSTVAYAIAFSQAVEAALEIAPPPRAAFLRALMAELERLANHLGDFGAICNDASFAIMLAQCAVLRERVLRVADACFGHRLMMDRVVPGGVAADLAAGDVGKLRELLGQIRERFPSLVNIYDSTASLQDRTATTGILTEVLARQFGAGGYVGRASGRDFDARRTPGYAPYDTLRFEVPVLFAGDVNARVWIRIREIEQSLGLIDQLLDGLPDGPVRADMPVRSGAREGLGLVEAFRGDVLAWVRLDADGKVARCHLRDPSWFQWPLLEAVIEGNIVADFPLCNKSFNCSYSGHDL